LIEQELSNKEIMFMKLENTQNERDELKLKLDELYHSKNFKDISSKRKNEFSVKREHWQIISMDNKFYGGERKGIENNQLDENNETKPKKPSVLVIYFNHY
jgi:hypothetical protein